jgi:virginiamycin B lyase
VRGLGGLLAILAALCVAAAPAASAAAHPPPPPHVDLVHMREGTEVEALAVGPESYLWFAGSNHGATPSNVVGRISPGGAVSEYTVPRTGSVLGVGGLARGPEGNMWFTEPVANRIERVSPTGSPEGFALPTAGSRPSGIVGAPGGFLWVTMEDTGKVAKVDPSAQTVTEIALGPGARPAAIALGSDSALWAVETESATLGRVGLDGGSSSFPLPTDGAIFEGALNSDIVAGPDGHLWLSQEDGPYVAMVVPTSTQPEYQRFEVPEKEEGTTLISNGPRGDLWYATEGGAIGSIATNGEEVGDPGCPLKDCAEIAALAEGPEGELWFASGETIGRYHPSPLFLAEHGYLRSAGSELKMPLECRGGAAGQQCKGTYEIFLGRYLEARGHFAIPTMTHRDVKLHFVDGGGRRKARKLGLHSHFVARLAGKTVPVYVAGD